MFARVRFLLLSIAFAGAVFPAPVFAFGPCCAPSSSPACTFDAQCTSCVCTADPYCCSTAWDTLCVELGGEECNGACGCGCPAAFADITGDGVASIVDVQCAIVSVLYTLGGSQSPPPSCLAGPLDTVDLQCNGTIEIGDVVLAIVTVLGTPMNPSVDPDGDSCPDACEAPIPQPCVGGGTGGCDDGNRCTTGEACTAGVCGGGQPVSCEDGDACTQDVCLPLVGCVHPSIPNCGSCAGPELADDGLDSDCNGVELFGPHPDPLALDGPIGPAPFSVGFSGDLHLGIFGVTPVSGTLVRATANGPVGWCANGNAAGPAGALVFSEANAKLCRGFGGSYAGSLVGALSDVGRPVSATGEFTATAPLTVSTDAPLFLATPEIGITSAEVAAFSGQAKALFGAIAAFDAGAFAMAAQGLYTSTGAVDVPLSPVGSPPSYAPFSSLPLALSVTSGGLARSPAGAWSAELFAQSLEASLLPGLPLAMVEASIAMAPGAGVSVALAGEADLGPLSVTLVGTLAKASPTASPTGCLQGSTAATVGGVSLSPVQVTVCPTEDPVVELAGTLHVGGDAFSFTGSVILQEPPVLTLSVHDFEIAPGLVMDTATLTTSGGAWTLSGAFTLGEGASALHLVATGAWSPQGDWSLAVELAPGTTWAPIPGVDLELDDVSGAVTSSGGDVTVTVTAGLSVPLTLVPGFTLTGVHVTGSWSDDTWTVAVSGSVHLDFGAFELDVAVSATVGDENVLVFSGSWNDTVAPLELFVGDAFLFGPAALVITVDLDVGTFVVTASGDATFCLFTPCSPDELAVFTVEVGVIVSDTSTGIWFRGGTGPLDLPVLGTIDLTFVATTIDLETFDVLDTPSDPNDDLDLEAGVHLVGTGPSPIAFGDSTVPLFYIVSVAGGAVTVEAEIPVNWTIIEPSSGFPGVEELTLDAMTLGGTLDPTSPSVFIGGQATFQPDNQSSPLIGTAEVELGFGLSVELGMEVLLEGRWLDMFGLTKFALQNPGFALTLLGSSPPVPSVIGFAGDVFWLKAGNTWPSESVWPVPDSAPSPGDPPPPPNVAQLGGTFYYDITPTPSGLCIVGVCAPLPTLVFRFEANQLQFPWDVYNVLGDFSAALMEAIPGAFPVLDPPNIDLSPLAITLERLVLTASTHNVEVFGLDYSSGLYGELAIDIYGTDVSLFGLADTNGMLFEGSVEAFDLLGLNVLEFSGNPFSKRCDVGGGNYLQVADANPLDQSTFTAEGWVEASSWGTGELAHTLFSKLSSSAGYAVGFGSAVGGKAKMTVKLRGAAGTRTVTTADAVLTPGALHHVAAVVSGSAVTLYIDGARQTTVATGPAVGAANSSAALQLGKGLDFIDDVRLWNVARTDAELTGHRRMLPDGYTNDTHLVARYEFDYDDEGGGLAHNTRYRATGDKLHASTIGATIVERAHEPLWIKFSLRAPGATPGEEGAGFWLKAGVTFAIPFLDWEIGAAVQVAIGEGTAFGSFYAPDIALLPIPEVGTLLAGGYGPNLVPSDFDDGLYGDIDLLQGSFSLTGKIAWEEPDGDEQVFAGASIAFECPTGTGCDPYVGNTLEVTGQVNLVMDPFGLGAVGITGAAEILVNSPDWHVIIEGDIVVFDLEFFSVTVAMDSEELTFKAVLDFGQVTVFGAEVDLGGVFMEFTFSFEDWELCGKGAYAQEPNEEIAVGFDCGVSICIGGPGWPLTPALGCGDFCLGAEFCAEDEICYFGVCSPKKSLGAFCGKDNHCKSDHCGCITDDAFLGVSAGVCYKESSKNLGEDCKVDAECKSQRCSAELCVTGKCVCDGDADCKPSEWCDEGDPLLGIGTNECKPLELDGEDCTGSNRCKSGHCSTESALDPCGYCFTPDSKTVGDSCRVDAECISDKCGYVCGAPGFGKCKCETDAQCGPNEYCGGGGNCNPKKPNCSTCDADHKCLSGVCTASILGTCITPSSVPVGGSCCHDDECTQGKCGPGGTCQCTEDWHCPANAYCALNGLNANTCEPKKPECDTCDSDRKCMSGNCTASVLGTCVTPDSKALGASCCHDEQCTTGRCGPSGTCECTENVHCASNKYCAVNGLNANTCEPKKADCETCDADYKCLSNNCTANVLGTCVQEGSKSLGQSCCHDEQCTTSRCGSNGICVCRYDSDCASNEYCADNGLNAASCEPKRNRGESCSSDSQCKSGDCRGVVGFQECIKENFAEIGEVCYSDVECIEGKCGSSGECVCTLDSHCSSTKYCADPLLGTAHCEPKKAECSTCDADNKCLSNECTSNISGKCITPNSLNIGVSCCHDDQCKSDRCGPNGLCECDVNADCASNKYCADNGLNANTCEPKKADCETCDADDKCLSNNCTAAVLGTCIDENSKDVGQSCCHDDQCIGSQKCQNGACRCTLDSHCDSDEWCSTPAFGTNSCQPKKNLGDSCDADRKCKSGCCKGGFIGIGQTCQSASECN